MPESLRIWNQWSIAVHFTLALVGVSAVRDADAVIEDRIRKLKAEAVEEDIITIRRAATNDNPLVLAAAKLRGLLDGMNLAIQLIRDKPDFSANNISNQVPDYSRRLYLPSGEVRTLTDNIGKMPETVNTASQLETNLQASSPTRDKSEGGEQLGIDWAEHPIRISVLGMHPTEVSNDPDEQKVSEQAKVSKGTEGLSKTGVHAGQVGEQNGEQGMENGDRERSQQLAATTLNGDKGEQSKSAHQTEERKQSDVQKPRIHEDSGKQAIHNKVSNNSGERSAQVILLSAAQRKRLSPSDRQTTDEQSARWLKSILPEVPKGNGWWDVRAKPKIFALMFRWRDPDLRVITLQGFTREQLETLMQISSEAGVRAIIREQIVASLHECSHDPAKTDKARIAAEKLGIDLEELDILHGLKAEDSYAERPTTARIS